MTNSSLIRLTPGASSGVLLGWVCACSSGEDPHACKAVADNPWNNNIEFSLSDPPRCPVPVAFQGQPKDVGASFLAFTERLWSDRVIMVFSDAQNITIQVLEPLWVPDVPELNRSQATVNSVYPAGIWRMQYEENNRDTVALETQLYLIPGAGVTYAYAGVHLPYTFVVHAAVAGPRTVHIGEWATMSVTAENVYAPSFTWHRNGVLISETGNQHTMFGSFLTTYNYSIAVRDGDGDSAVVTHVIQVIPYVASVTGYSEVQPYATCTWYAATDLSSPPYEYEWRVDGVLESTSENLVYQAPASSFTIDVKVTNSAGQFAFGLLDVSVATWAQECLDM